MIASYLLQPSEPRTRRWTREEYYQMAELGWFQSQRVELIDGEIIEMSPQSNSHAVATALVERALREAFGEGYWIRNQIPFHARGPSEPEPDLAVVAGNPRDFRDHPSFSLLVVEVSDSTLSLDSKHKAGIYAGSGIPEYWIVNLVRGCLDVYRNPLPDPTTAIGFCYADVRSLGAGEFISPLARPDVRVAVADLLP